MTDVFAAPDDFGEIKASDIHTSLGERLWAQGAETLSESTGAGLVRETGREMAARGNTLPIGAAGELDVYGGDSLAQRQQAIDAAAAAVPETGIDAARQRVKEEGLEGHLSLPDQPAMKTPVLDMMIQHAREKRSREAAIARGPQSFVAGALGFVTSIGAGLLDPVSDAAFAIPVVGEARWGKIIAGAGDSILGRAALNAGRGAAQGAVGMAALQPADWWLHTADGQDYTMADAMHSIVLGAGMGAAFHAGGGVLSDIVARWRGERLGAPQATGEAPPMHPAEVLADLPPEARADVLRGAMADVINGNEVRAAEMLDVAAKHDPRIAEAVESPQAEVGVPPRDAVYQDIQAKLLAAGVPAEEADANAAIVAARYDARAQRLGGRAGTALDLYRGEGIDVRAGEFAGGSVPEGARAFQQPAMVGGVEVNFPDRDHLALYQLGQRLAGGEKVDEAEVRQLLDRFKGFMVTDPAYGEHLRNTRDMREAARDYFAAIKEDAARGRPFEAYDVIEPDEKATWYRRALDEARQAAEGVAARGTAGAEGLKARAPQREADEGLFAGQAAQRSFFQSASAPTFYSVVGRTIDNAKQEKASPEQWLGVLKNAAGVKPEEMKWLGLEDWLRQQKGSVTRAQIRDYLRANGLELREVVKGGEGARYGRYQLPGGENYREMLLTLPPKSGIEGNAVAAFARQMHEKYGERWISLATPAEQERYDALIEAQERSPSQPERENYRSSHWGEPNVLAHVRMSDRTIDGKRALHIEEVQSDWHQAGRKSGYQRSAAEVDRDIAAVKHELRGLEPSIDEASSQSWGEAFERHPDLLRRYDDLLNERGSRRVPDAPFKTTWPELAMKRMIRYAADHGYDKVVWTPGEAQAERYDLSKQIARVEFEKAGDSGFTRHEDIESRASGRLKAWDHSGRRVVDRWVEDQNDLPGIVGKEVADRLLGQNPRRSAQSGLATSVRELSGLDLKVGGEGMLGFYDDILPATVGKLIRKFGGKVGSDTLEVAGAPPFVVRDRAGNIVERGIQSEDYAQQRAGELGGSYALEEHRTVPVHSFDITPELRRAAVEQGFPLFQGGETPRGRITLSDSRAIIDLYKGRDASTFMHEAGHLWLDELMRDAARAEAPEGLKADRDAVLRWLGVERPDQIGVEQHEQFARGFEAYLAEGRAPSAALAAAFEKFKQWMLTIYRALAGRQAEISDEVRGVIDRMLASDQELAARRGREAESGPASAHDVTTTHVAPASLRGRRAAHPHTWSLTEFLAHEGGLKPTADLEHIFGSSRGPFVPGFGPLFRRNGLTLDDAYTRAKEGHYFFDPRDLEKGAGGATGQAAGVNPHSTRELLAALADHAHGRRRYRMDHLEETKVDGDHEAHVILAALRDEIEAATGLKDVDVDPEIERRVVEIVTREGERDVLAAYDRAIMEADYGHEGVTDELERNDQHVSVPPGWDVERPGGAPPAGEALARKGGAAGFPGQGEGRAPGVAPRGGGAGGGGPRPAGALKGQSPAADPAWRKLADTTPDYLDPDAIAESQWAADVPAPRSLEPGESGAALREAVVEAEEIWKALEPTLTDEERAAFNQVLADMDREAEARAQVVRDGAACLARAYL